MVQQRPLTLESATSLFLQELAQPDLSGQQEVANLLRWFGRDSLLTAVTPRDVEDYCTVVCGNGEGTANRRIKFLRQLFTFADKQGGLPIPLAPHVKLRRAGRSAQAGRKRAQEPVRLTPEGHTRLRERLDVLQEELVRAAEDIHKAAADKDVSENAPLEAAREHQGHLMAQLRSIQATLENAEVVSDLAKVAEATVHQGSRVTLRELATEKEVAYQLVDSSEINPLGGRISTASPLGRALIDHGVGDEVAVTSPRGTVRYRVVRIE